MHQAGRVRLGGAQRGGLGPGARGTIAGGNAGDTAVWDTVDLYGDDTLAQYSVQRREVEGSSPVRGEPHAGP